MENARVVGKLSRRFRPGEFTQTVTTRSAPARTWLLYSHRQQNHAALIDGLTNRIPRLDAWDGQGAGCHLFDVSSLLAGSPAVPGEPGETDEDTEPRPP
jgi:hypothetical protein